MKTRHNCEEFRMYKNLLLVITAFSVGSAVFWQQKGNFTFQLCREDVKCLGIDKTTKSVVIADANKENNVHYLWKLNEQGLLVSTLANNSLGLDISLPASCIGSKLFYYDTIPVYNLQAKQYDVRTKTQKWILVVNKTTSDYNLTRIINEEINSTIFIGNEEPSKAMVITEIVKTETNISLNFYDNTQICGEAVAFFERKRLGYFLNKTYTFCRNISSIPHTMCLTSGTKIEFKPENGNLSQQWVYNEYGYLVSSLNGFGIDIDWEYSYKCGKNDDSLMDQDKKEEKAVVGLVSTPFVDGKGTMRWRVDSTESTITNYPGYLIVHHLFQKRCGTDSYKLDSSSRNAFQTVAIYEWNRNSLYLDDCPRSFDCQLSITSFRDNRFENNAGFRICEKKTPMCLKSIFMSELQLTTRDTNPRITSDQLWEYNDYGFINKYQSTDGIGLSRDLVCVTYTKNQVTVANVPAYKVVLKVFELEKKSMRWKLENFNDGKLVNVEVNLTILLRVHPSTPVLAIHGMLSDGLNVTSIDHNLETSSCFENVVAYENTYLSNEKIMFMWCSQPLVNRTYGSLNCLTCKENELAFENKTELPNQFWFRNQHGYLVSRDNENGIDLVNHTMPICGRIRKDNTSNFINVVGFQLIPARFDINKKTMLWSDLGSSVRIVNRKLNLQLHIAKFENCTPRINSSASFIGIFGVDKRFLNDAFSCTDIELCKNDLESFNSRLNN
ncbi:hypothetical protein HELRODRAFT_183228 [Helobdella robusta]|uniref:Uncharacterized protein n=1 Tax=Helobdella robusta TaxID=6412 RepID=T1FJC5_HELRO|nr:hypothetical protein HELRODRAFT_183228 [Helobdella robusta]ESO11441.1 hypothetical protein HELRODRAFT_183228 [Helobdella robusta]